MASEPPLDAQQLFPLPTVAADLVAFRWCSYDVPFWARPNTRPGRWNRAGDEPTQYWSLSPESCWADLIRHENLRTESDLDLVRMPFWVCRVSSMLIVDFTDRETCVRYGVTGDELVADDYAPCQELGALVRARSSALGVIAPSAALLGHRNLTLFGARRPIMWGAQPALASAIPATQAALGRAPEGLIDDVRRLSDRPADRLF